MAPSVSELVLFLCGVTSVLTATKTTTNNDYSPIAWFVVDAFSPRANPHPSATRRSSTSSSDDVATASAKTNDDDSSSLFDEFCSFLLDRQERIVALLESEDARGARFSRDAWGCFENNNDDDDGSTSTAKGTGGVTRVLQDGSFVEKGACSVTIVRDGVLSAERARSIRERRENDVVIEEGDRYSAAALSMVLHSRSPSVPTFRSDVRLFVVRRTNDDENDGVLAWFGGGADLTPYYLCDEDVREFHTRYRDLCLEHFAPDGDAVYRRMKKQCDDYFYLPARSEHRGTGGVFFDDEDASTETFVRALVDAWMPSWLGIVKRRHQDDDNDDNDDRRRRWQLLRRGRYLEFNLLYDRGVRFGLGAANPRVEGVMVSAPPLIAWEYNHEVEKGSEEERLLTVLKTPRDWA